MTTTTITFDSIHRQTVSQALLSPVREAAKKQARYERDLEIGGAFAGSSIFEAPEKADKRTFAENAELIRLSREAAGLSTDDIHACWRALVDTAKTLF